MNYNLMPSAPQCIPYNQLPPIHPDQQIWMILPPPQQLPPSIQSQPDPRSQLAELVDNSAHYAQIECCCCYCKYSYWCLGVFMLFLVSTPTDIDKICTEGNNVNSNHPHTTVHSSDLHQIVHLTGKKLYCTFRTLAMIVESASVAGASRHL